MAFRDPAVKKFIDDKKRQQQELEDAKNAQGNVGIANTAGQLANTFSNANQDSVVLANRLQDLGKAPKVISPEQRQFSDFGAADTAARGVGEAKEALATTDKNLKTDLLLDERNRFNDPASEDSQVAREMLKRVAPNSTSMENFDQLSAAQVKRIAGPLGNTFQAEQARISRERMARLRKQGSGGKGGGGTPLTHGEKSLDVKTAAVVSEWTSAKGRPQVMDSLQKLKGVAAAMIAEQKADPEAFEENARFEGRLPDLFRDQKLIERREIIHAAIQNTLKPTLGGQFARIEGENVFKRAYDDTLSPAANLRKMQDTIKRLETGVSSLDAQTKHFRETGSIKGFKGPEFGAKSGDSSSLVKMTTPDGRTFSVPSDRVKDMEAKGAKRN
jgi:hypothetical protein